MAAFLELAHMWDATQLMGWLHSLHLHTCEMLYAIDGIPCNCTHVRCYATDGVGMVTFLLALAHM